MVTSLTGPPPKIDPAAKAWGEELRYRRTELLKLNQTEMAGKLGVHQTTVSQIERGVLVPSPRLQRSIIETCLLDDRTVVRLVKGAA